MARLTQISQTSSSSSYSQGVSHTIYKEISVSVEDALKLVSKGEIEGWMLYHKAPKELCDELDQVSTELFQLPFNGLSKDRQKEVCRQILSPPTVSLETLQLVSIGKLSGQLFYDQAPKQFCEVLDQLCKERFQTSFKKLSKERQEEVCSMLLNAIVEANASEPKEKPRF